MWQDGLINEKVASIKSEPALPLTQAQHIKVSNWYQLLSFLQVVLCVKSHDAKQTAGLCAEKSLEYTLVWYASPRWIFHRAQPSFYCEELCVLVCVCDRKFSGMLTWQLFCYQEQSWNCTTGKSPCEEVSDFYWIMMDKSWAGLIQIHLFWLYHLIKVILSSGHKDNQKNMFILV